MTRTSPHSIVIRTHLPLIAAILAAALSNGPRAEPVTLITPEEARLPPAEVVPKRAIARGPEIRVESPKPGEAVRSPLRIYIGFKPHGGVAIDPDSIELRYLRQPAVALTGRVKRFVKPNGLVIDEASVPPGEHDLQLTLRDNDDREAVLVFRLVVRP